MVKRLTAMNFSPLPVTQYRTMPYEETEEATSQEENDHDSCRQTTTTGPEHPKPPTAVAGQWFVETFYDRFGKAQGHTKADWRQSIETADVSEACV